MAPVIKINGCPLDSSIFLKDKLNQEIKKTEEHIGKFNRKTRRDKRFKLAVGVFGLISSIATASIAKAESLDPSLKEVSLDPQKGIGDKIINRIGDKIEEEISEHIVREDTLLWKLNEYMTSTIMDTHDFFSNPSILSIYMTISQITMSFLTIIVAKKGFDMVKAKMIGTETIGVPELMLRILASIVMSFLSLKVISFGIEMSNAIVSVFIKNIANTQIVPKMDTGFGAIMWLIAYILMFSILAVRYWVRQINLIILGVITPIANMSWIVDGGRMLNTLIKEIVVSLATPITQAIILTIGTVVITEVSYTVEGVTAFLSQAFIGLSALFLMIVTPEFLRKFTHGSANPLGWAFQTAINLKSAPANLMKLFK